MCLSVPAKLIEVDGPRGKADIGGTVLELDLSLVEGVTVGNYVLVHAGFAIEHYDEQEAEETIGMLREAFKDTDAPPAGLME